MSTAPSPRERGLSGRGVACLDPRPWAPLLAGLLAGLLAAHPGARAAQPRPRAAEAKAHAIMPPVGSYAPRFALARLTPQPEASGERFATADVVGPRAAKPARALVVVFSASWCAPCMRELPALVKLVRPLLSRGVRAVVVVVDREPQGLEAMRHTLLEDLALPFPAVHDRLGIVARRYDAANLPKSVVLDGQGRVVAVHEGYAPDTLKKLRAELEALASPLATTGTRSKGKRRHRRHRHKGRHGGER